MIRKRPDKYKIQLTYAELRVLRQALVEYRNLLIRKSLPTEDIDKIMLKIYK